MVKGERRHKREEIRRIVAEDERRRKEKQKKKDNGKKATYRKDKDGNVILFGNLRKLKNVRKRFIKENPLKLNH